MRGNNFKVKIVTKEELKKCQENERFRSLPSMVGESFKIGGSTEAQTGAMLMYRIIGLERLLLDLPIEGVIGEDLLILKTEDQPCESGEG